jgi:hypothetical protein
VKGCREASPQAVATNDFAGVDNHWSCNADARLFRIFPRPSKHAALHNGLERTGRLGFATSLGDLSPITFHIPPAFPSWLLDSGSSPSDIDNPQTRQTFPKYPIRSYEPQKHGCSPY